ncbi:Alpha/Beta hydrolase protein [Podospora aff. communis PSN243]|uniref:Carboxylic ester hydrolase n=1 Tax=Podospora aff. communis PSN243 TaxID=3040156 RepID=A0AAV9GDN0_9PEZI|nr:Alpha/Beta hydrolase protein [Podospora aff. communis PSN243]
MHLLTSVSIALSGFGLASGLAPPYSNNSAPIVDLGYSRYRGYHDLKLDANVYKGIRFAAPPKRWQRPEAPKTNRTSVIDAVHNPPRCPQCLPTSAFIPVGNFTDTFQGDEDCLFLSVVSPRKAKNLPVLFWIHGGGYGAGWADLVDLSPVGQSLDNSIVIVSIQYRLGAFGFLASKDVADNGVLNAGLHDIRFALEWVQKYINRFGGDPEQVTVVGESAGGGAVMLLATANGGTEGSKLFKRGIASSPYFPIQHMFSDEAPTNNYLHLARQANCLGAHDSVDSASDRKLVFQCLQEADTMVLQKANAEITYNGTYGRWPFVPVTDGALLREQPPTALLNKRVNGERILTANNANEGAFFVSLNITTQSDFETYVHHSFPRVAAKDMTAILSAYSVPTGFTSPKFNTDGLHPPFATHVSSTAVGWQQAAINLYAEATFVCPSYWLGTAYESNGSDGKKAWRYQFSVPEAYHSLDLTPLQSDPGSVDASIAFDGTFARGFQQIWSRFITTGDPTLPVDGGSQELVAAERQSWVSWGEVAVCLVGSECNGRGASKWTVADGLTWEGGRWERCNLWARIGVA